MVFLCQNTCLYSLNHDNPKSFLLKARLNVCFKKESLDKNFKIS